MSASVTQPAEHGQEQHLVDATRGSGAGRGARKIVLVGFLLSTCLVGCSSDGSIAADPLPTASSSAPTASPTLADEQQAILSQYRLFWSSLTPVSKMPAAQRRAALAKYTVDPELKSLLAGLAQTDAKKQVFYGADRPRATQASISPDGVKAVIDDCQDSSQSGNADRATGRKVTVGVARNHVVVTMTRSDGVWKVYFVSHTKTRC